MDKPDNDNEPAPPESRSAGFSIGQCIQHRRFDYRGVVYDVDPVFQGSEEWYAQMARSRPPKDKPWYHVLVHDASHTTYVAERNLEADLAPEPVKHPLIDAIFDEFVEGTYRRRGHQN